MKPTSLRLRRAAAPLFALAVLGLVRLPGANPPPDLPPFRLGFSSAVFVEANENDIRAALKVWAETLGADRGFPVDPAILILNGHAAIKGALLARRVDGMSMTAPEFWAMRDVAPLGPFVMGRLHGETSVEYILVVHRDSPASRLADLRGKRLNLIAGARASLAGVWLETLLLQQHLGPSASFWQRTTQASKLNLVALPVFFRQADACVVTLAGFRTLCELNPQVGRQLRILAQSEPLAPTVFCFCGDLVAQNRDRFMTQITAIASTAVGRQFLTLFQSEQMSECPESEMDSACALLDLHRRLLAETGGPAPLQTDVEPAAPEGGPRR